MLTNPPRRKLLGGAALFAAFALAAGTALAQPGPGPGPGAGPGRGRVARAVREAMSILDLTDAQKAKVKAIFAAQRTENAAFRAQVQADRAALKAAAAAVDPDPATVGAAFLKVRANGKAVAEKMKAVRAQIEAVLTPEQKAKLAGWTAARRQMRGMGGQRWGMGGHGGPPQN